MKLTFRWDRQKARSNLHKHQISFDEAKTIFNDPLLVTYPDEFHSEREARWISIGVSSRNRILLVVHAEWETSADELVVRIISSRKATPLERKTYEQQEA